MVRPAVFSFKQQNNLSILQKDYLLKLKMNVVPICELLCAPYAFCFLTRRDCRKCGGDEAVKDGIIFGAFCWGIIALLPAGLLLAYLTYSPS